jgi:hypothetical protein
MSIDARISRVEYNPDGTATFHLEPRDPRTAPAGQSKLIVSNPRPGLELLVQVEIWGNDSTIMRGDVKFAERLSATKIKLV